MQLQELLNTKIDYKIIADTHVEFSAKAAVGDREIIVEIIRDEYADDDTWQLAFKESKDHGEFRTSTYSATGSGKEFEVFAFVKDVVFDFIKKKNPYLIIFTAEKEQGDSTRADLYDRLAKRLVVSGYRRHRESGDYRDFFSFVRIDK